MNNTELLCAISDMMDQKLEEKLDRKLDQKFDQKLEPVIQRLDRIEGTMDNEVLPRIKKLEDEVLPRIKKLEDEALPRIKKLEIHMENELIPRVSHIEECYISTYERYQRGIDQLDKMQADIDVIKIAVTSHSEAINKFTGPYLVK